jgi:hypothetical protein
MSVDSNCQSVECRSDTGRQLRLQFGVTGAVREMREPRLSRSDFLCRTHGLGYAEVRRVWRPKKGVEDQDINASKRPNRIFRQLLGVSDVAEVADTIGIDSSGPVWNGDRRYIDISNAKGLAGRHRVSAPFGLARSGKRTNRVVEDVCEAVHQSCDRIGRSIHVDRNVPLVGQRANVVNAMDVVRVIVREENGVHSARASRDELKSKLGRSIDEDVRTSIRLDQSSDTSPLVAGVR